MSADRNYISGESRARNYGALTTRRRTHARTHARSRAHGRSRPDGHAVTTRSVTPRGTTDRTRRHPSKPFVGPRGRARAGVTEIIIGTIRVGFVFRYATATGRLVYRLLLLLLYTAACLTRTENAEIRSGRGGINYESPPPPLPPHSVCRRANRPRRARPPISRFVFVGPRPAVTTDHRTRTDFYSSPPPPRPIRRLPARRVLPTADYNRIKPNRRPSVGKPTTSPPRP